MSLLPSEFAVARKVMTFSSPAPSTPRDIGKLVPSEMVTPSGSSSWSMTSVVVAAMPTLLTVTWYSIWSPTITASVQFLVIMSSGIGVQCLIANTLWQWAFSIAGTKAIMCESPITGEVIVHQVWPGSTSKSCMRTCGSGSQRLPAWRISFSSFV